MQPRCGRQGHPADHRLPYEKRGVETGVEMTIATTGQSGVYELVQKYGSVPIYRSSLAFGSSQWRHILCARLLDCCPNRDQHCHR